MNIREKLKKHGLNRRQFLVTLAGTGVCLSVPSLLEKRQSLAQTVSTTNLLFSQPGEILDAVTIPQFVDPLPVPDNAPGGWSLIKAGKETVRLVERDVQVLPTGMPKTKVWCYRGDAEYDHTFIGPTLWATSFEASRVKYDYSGITATTHLLKNAYGSSSVIDKHIHGTNSRDMNPSKQSEPEVRFITHLHGAKGVQPDSDGYPESWVTPRGETSQSLGFVTPPTGTVPKTSGGAHTHTYSNRQVASFAWYHDHTLGNSRLNLYAGMAGAYLITDDAEAEYIGKKLLPKLGGSFDIPLIIQDRMFYRNGNLAYPDKDAISGDLISSPGCTNTWNPNDVATLPEFFGDVMLVNGKAWPYLEVDPAIYRFRLLNACNSRVVNLFVSMGTDIYIIGNEGGLLPDKSIIPYDRLLMGPAERLDVLIDFRPYAGKKLTMRNRGAKKPYPSGDPPIKGLDDLVMQFRVRKKPILDPAQGINSLYWGRWNRKKNLTQPKEAVTTRRVLLYEGRDSFGRIQPILGSLSPSTGNANGPFTAQPLFWTDPVTENPRANTVEIWEIFNTTADAHPIHMHEGTFSVWQREKLLYKKNLADAVAGTCPSPTPPTFPPFPSLRLSGDVRPGEDFEQGFKDTALCFPGEVTRFVVDFSDTETGRFVWHCHILEHEDHEMMRPFNIV